MKPAITVRDETDADVNAIAEVTVAAFKTLAISRHTEQFIIEALRAANALRVSLVAEGDGRVVGHIAFSPVTLSDGSANWYGLGPLSVLPDYQRQGIGSALILEGLSRLKGIGACGCCLVGHPDYYRRFGFQNIRGLLHAGVPEEVFLALVFDGRIPQGTVEFHEGFKADGHMNAADHTISTEDGRKLRISEAGQPEGVPVLVLRGTPQSRLLYDGWIEDAQSRGIRLIGYERPGYGGSTAQPGRTVASAANDVAAIAKEFGLNRLFVWGVSGGGPHALACAALLPDLVAAAAALCSIAPYPAEGLDWFAGMDESNAADSRAALKSREACEQSVEASLSELLRATPETLVQALHSALCPVDAEVLTTDFADFVIRSVREGIGEKRAGVVDDEIAFVKPWGFELSQIRIPVLIMHGGHDRMVPFSHGKWLANKIPNVEARLLAEDGHLTLSLRRIPEVHAWLLSKR